MSNAADNASRRSTPSGRGATPIFTSRTTTTQPSDSTATRLLQRAADKGARMSPMLGGAIRAPASLAGNISDRPQLRALLNMAADAGRAKREADKSAALFVAPSDDESSEPDAQATPDVEKTPRAKRPQRARQAAPPPLPSLVSADAQQAAALDESGAARRKRRRANTKGESIDTTDSTGSAVHADEEEDAPARPAARRTTATKIRVDTNIPAAVSSLASAVSTTSSNVVPPPVKKRGRPKKAATSAQVVVDEGDDAASVVVPSPAQARGRIKKSAPPKNDTAAAPAKKTKKPSRLPPCKTEEELLAWANEPVRSRYSCKLCTDQNLNCWMDADPKCRATNCLKCRTHSKTCEWPEHWADENTIAASTAATSIAQANVLLVRYIVRARPELLDHLFVRRVATDLGFL